MIPLADFRGRSVHHPHPVSGEHPRNVLVGIVEPSGAAGTLNMPDARRLNIGHKFVMINLGNRSVLLQNVSGGLIVDLTANKGTKLFLVDNSTAAGTWRATSLRNAVKGSALA
jgi:hypothetical protein